jgi:excinuclease ABC subunit C
LGGKDTVGVMIVVEDGEPVKNEYRKFILNKNPNGSDTAGLREVLERRFTHSEWPFPQIIAVDGGMAQINITKKTLEEYFGDDIINKVRVVGVVKDEHHRPKKILSDKHISQEKEGEILLANNEAHRFSIQFHRKKRAQKMKAR